MPYVATHPGCSSSPGIPVAPITARHRRPATGAPPPMGRRGRNSNRVDPNLHLKFAGPAITSLPGDDLGKRTVAKLRLMREALILERAKRIQALADMIDTWSRALDPDENRSMQRWLMMSLMTELNLRLPYAPSPNSLAFLFPMPPRSML